MEETHKLWIGESWGRIEHEVIEADYAGINYYTNRYGRNIQECLYRTLDGRNAVHVVESWMDGRTARQTASLYRQVAREQLLQHGQFAELGRKCGLW